MTCIPLKSGLNIPVWEDLLRDYPDKHLIEYLKFGFPPDAIHNQSARNHHYSLQFTDAVEEYIYQEKSLGAHLGPA